MMIKKLKVNLKKKKNPIRRRNNLSEIKSNAVRKYLPNL